MPGRWIFENRNDAPRNYCCFCGNPIKGVPMYQLWGDRVCTPHGRFHGGFMAGYVHRVCPNSDDELMGL